MAHFQCNFEEMLNVATQAALEAGSALLQTSRQNIRIFAKSDGTRCTNMDIEAEEIIIRILREHFPDFGFLGEETGASGEKNVRWICDPIDGTELFIANIPCWSIMLAFELEGKIILGVIYNPSTGELYRAFSGGGAFLNNRQIFVSRKKSLSESSLLFSGKEEMLGSRFWPGLKQLICKTGSTAEIGEYFGWMFVACGFWELGAHYDLGPEDIVAAKIIIEEAGGRLTDIEGRDTIYSGHALVSNGILHGQALKIINST